MRRREFIVGLSGAAAAWPIAARAQQQAQALIGFLSGRSEKSDAKLVAAFNRGVAATGLVAGRNYKIEFRWADGRISQLPTLVAEFTQKNVAILVAADSGSARAATSVASKTPVVFYSGGDPTKLGLVASFNRPGGNITGVTGLGHSLSGKRLEILRQLVPNATEIAFLLDSKNPSADKDTAEVLDAARSVGQKVLILKVDSEDFNSFFAKVVQLQVRAVLVSGGPLFSNRSQQLIALAARYAIPTMYNVREYVDDGGLASYGTSLQDSFWQMGVYAGRILQGEKPADLPVMQPTKFELAINLKTAKLLGLTVPPALLTSADEVIE